MEDRIGEMKAICADFVKTLMRMKKRFPE